MIFGFVDVVFWGEFGGFWGKEEYLIWNIGEGMVLGLFDFLGFFLRVRFIIFGMWGCNIYL